MLSLAPKCKGAVRGSRCLGGRQASGLEASPWSTRPILGIADAEYGLSDELDGLAGEFLLIRIFSVADVPDCAACLQIHSSSVTTDDIRQI